MFSNLNQRAALEALVLAPDGGGGHSESWRVFAQVWVKIVPISAAEFARASARESRARHRILLRRRKDLAAGQRLSVGDRRFTVHGVLDAGSHAPLSTLLCEELPC